MEALCASIEQKKNSNTRTPRCPVVAVTIDRLAQLQVTMPREYLKVGKWFHLFSAVNVNGGYCGPMSPLICSRWHTLSVNLNLY